jgi:hypothetical protein
VTIGDAIFEAIPSPGGGFAQKVGFEANLLTFNALSLSTLLSTLNFWAKPLPGEGRGERNSTARQLPTALILTLFQRQRGHRLGVSPDAQTPDGKGNK